MKMAPKISRKSLRCSLGAAVIEAMIGLPVFLFVLLNGVQMAVSLYSMMAIESSLARTLRRVIVNPDLNRVQAIENIVIESGQAYGVRFDRNEIEVCLADQPFCAGNESAGGPNDYISINVRKDVRFLFALNPDFRNPSGQGLVVNYAFRVISRNEPF